MPRLLAKNARENILLEWFQPPLHIPVGEWLPEEPAVAAAVVIVPGDRVVPVAIRNFEI
jgi:hypothetical protein